MLNSTSSEIPQKPKLSPKFSLNIAQCDSFEINKNKEDAEGIKILPLDNQNFDLKLSSSNSSSNNRGKNIFLRI
jgi:hypothetical protein